MFFPLKFSTLNTWHHTPFLYVSISLPYTVLLPHVFCRNKTKTLLYQFCIQMGPTSLCSWSTVVLHCADSGAVPHTERSRWLLDPSHKTLTLTISVLPDSSAIHSFIHWHSHSNTNHTTDSWTVNFPSPCTSDTHHCTQCMLFQGPYTAFYVPKVS
jgi:hypothetical protein